MPIRAKDTEFIAVPRIAEVMTVTPLNASYILYLIREGYAKRVEDLMRHFGANWGISASVLYGTLKHLERAKLIKIGDKKSKNYSLQVTSTLQNVQCALELSLSALARTDPSQRRIVEPIFETSQDPQYSNDIFVLMPFAEELQIVYRECLKKVASELRLKIGRADDFFTSKNIMSEIWSAIWHAKIVVADCTGRNPNVFYEIGLAHTIGKRVILLAQSGEDIPFDLRHLRFILYSLDIQSRGTFEFQLSNAITGTLGEANARALPPKKSPNVMETFL